MLKMVLRINRIYPYSMSYEPMLAVGGELEAIDALNGYPDVNAPWWAGVSKIMVVVLLVCFLVFWTCYKENRERRLREAKDLYWATDPTKARQELREKWDSLCAQRVKLLERGCGLFSQGRWARRIWRIDCELHEIRMELERQTRLSYPQEPTHNSDS